MHSDRFPFGTGAGVGKSSLVHLISQGTPLTTGSWTVGCSVEVAMMESSDTFVECGIFGNKLIDMNNLFINWILKLYVIMTVSLRYWDVGGNPKYAESRRMFYHDVDGK